MFKLHSTIFDKIDIGVEKIDLMVDKFDIINFNVFHIFDNVNFKPENFIIYNRKTKFQ